MDGCVYGAGAKSHPKFFQDPPGQMHLAGPVPPRNLATSPSMCSALGSCLQDQISGVCPSDPKLEVGGPFLSPAGLAPFLASPYPSWGLGLPCRPLGRSMVFTSSSAISKAFRPLSFFSQKSYRRTDRCEANNTAKHPHAQVNHSSPMMAKARPHVVQWLVSA